MTVQIPIGDCRDVLRTLPDESVHCVVSSPPYWGLRDYGNGISGIGNEGSVDDHMEAIVAVFREVRRVLRSDGTLWLNYGDAYAAGHGGSTTAGSYTPKVSRQRPSSMQEREDVDVGGWGKTDASLRLVRAGFKAKDLLGLPWRAAFALQADGWWLRQDIIWAKPNPMPESVTDRCTKAHEYIFLMSKRARYWYDALAISEPFTGNPPGRATIKVNTDRNDGGNVCGRPESGLRNRRSVWIVPSEPFAEGHFATFPPALIEPCILAGCPKGGTVLDPFGGAGTTGLVADRLGRNAILIELNPQYAAMARRRIEGDAGMFAQVDGAA